MSALLHALMWAVQQSLNTNTFFFFLVFHTQQFNVSRNYQNRQGPQFFFFFLIVA